MRNRCLFPLLMLCVLLAEGTLFAQNPGEKLNRKLSAEYEKDGKLSHKHLIEASVEPTGPQSNVHLVGVAQTGTVVLQTDCTPDPNNPLGPDDRCVVVDNTTATLVPFDFRDIGRITVPGNSAQNTFLTVTNHVFFYRMGNGTGSSVFAPGGLFNSVPYITIESDALNDPQAVDPITGLPLNGKLDIGLGAQRGVSMSMVVGQRFKEGLRYSRIGELSKSFFVNVVQLSPAIVDRMFRGQITFRLNLMGGSELVEFGFVGYSFRLMGD